MTEFDNLLKEKVEQAKYSYKASVWKKLVRKMNPTTALKPMQWIGIGASALMVVGVVSVLLLNHRSTPSARTPLPKETAIICQDTVTNEKVEKSRGEVCEEVEVVVPHKRSQSMKSKVSDTIDHNPTLNVSAEKTKEKTRKVEIIRGRAVTIQVDTITQMGASEEQLRKGNSRIF